MLSSDILGPIKGSSHDVDGILSSLSAGCFRTRTLRGVLLLFSEGRLGKFSVGILLVWRVFLEFGLSASTKISITPFIVLILK